MEKQPCLLVLDLIYYVLTLVTTQTYLNSSYSFHGRKYEHALKHGSKIGLSVVTLGWFVDSVRRNGKDHSFLFLLFEVAWDDKFKI